MMPPSISRPARAKRRTGGGASRPARALMVIDHQRLQAAAWAEFHSARKRMEKAARDLHRHENVDAPAFQQWLHQTFPVVVSKLRELAAAVASRAQKIQAAQAEAFFFGGSLKRIWRDHREREAHPERFPEPDSDSDETGARARADDDDEGAFRSMMDEAPTPSLDARAIYRRLVQRLHPDRGGAWTAERERLWHQVQEAWAAGDVDWLSRLEVEWESANDLLGPSSPLSRLRRAIEETHAARRDIERKLREYRREPSWRFTKAKSKRPFLEAKLEREFLSELESLQRQLDHMNRTIASWEADWTKEAGARKRRRH